jgi:uncharacterized protein (TIGR01777 family)
MTPRIVLAGGNGFIGRLLTKSFVAENYEVVILTRSPVAGESAIRQVRWDGRTRGDWAGELEGADALINLAGRSVNCRYNARNRREILESRVDSTCVLGEAVARCNTPPAVWLYASTATIYKHTFDRQMDEATGEIGGTPEAKDEFSIEVARAWEETLSEAPTPVTRKVALRTAMVFAASKGGVYRTLRGLTRWGLGGTIAGGRQFISWIHEADFCHSVEWLISRDDFSGPVNVASPNPIPQREMMRIIRRACGVPFGLPATRRMLEVAAFVHRTEAELILKSRRVVPSRLLAEGFQFRFPRMEDAVRDIEDPYDWVRDWNDRTESASSSNYS